MKFRLVAGVLVISLLSSCGAGSWFGSKEPPIEDLSAQEIFARGESEMESRDYKKAAETFDEVERLYPFSQLAKRAMIMSAFASYEGGDMPSARAAANRYLDLYPSDVDAPYAQYLVALTWYDHIADVRRDQATTRNALRELNELVRRYPDSDYARDAALKIDLTNDHLAGKEMTVGRYYLKGGHYTAAINRFREVIEKYQNTSHTPEALHRLVESYLALGLDQEAQVVAAVLGENFVGSDWYARSYGLLTDRHLLPASRSDGFFNRVYRRVILGEWM